MGPATDVYTENPLGGEPVSGQPLFSKTHGQSAAPVHPGRAPVRLLDPHTVNQIAAGEVVERPASVVKELLENALDAGATRVLVTLEDAGRRLIEIADDGSGMDSETLGLALQRHATSKIRSVEDLDQVSTLGFRGEALPSIASVSRTLVASGTEDGVRWTVEAQDGVVSPPSPGPGPAGTTVRVEALFYNTPARLKFLKSDATELAACLDVVSRAALARPDVAFTATHNGTTLVRTSGSGDLSTAVSEVWGADAARALAPVDRFNGSARVRGFVSPPHFTKPTRSQQWFFVNGRPVRSRTLQAALDQAFRSLTPERRYPLAVLLVDIDPAEVDVNVSPTKSEVRFRREGGVFDAVRGGVLSALLETGMVPHAEGLAAANAALAAQSGAQGALDWSRPFQSGAANGPRTLTGPAGGTGAGPGALWTGAIDAQRPLAEAASESPESFVRFAEGLRVLGQIDDTYIVAENADSLVIVDQHVAHERVIYERLRDSRGLAPVEVQPLLEPETLHVGARAAGLLAERLEELALIGFELEPFGGESFLVRSVPALWRGRPPLQVLRDIADELVEDPLTGGLTATRDEVYILGACKMAVKAGDRLSVAEMEKLLLDLGKTENPYLCPHGRPITIVLPKTDLARRFKRH
ncbi:MAG: DNA mismatch repair endonuclease MutL [Fimbriimonadaceae bacterium]|nr:DNA mismatch repair endonuclease MutL [Fimbriimonadaceae bacterium]QYK57588.1 MAG: DNA mismatch repair endonuclease MutL [Fimbriimonadaceae bacterium]